MDKSLALQAINLSKTYRMGKISVPALRDINLKVVRGGFVAVQGPSGSGKTTLLNMLSGLDYPTSGEVLIEEVNITKMSEKQLSHIRCQRVGFVFQFYNLIPNLPAINNVEVPMIFAKTHKHLRKKRARTLLENVRLAGKLQHCPHELSAGEQQRVAIARALANTPAIVFMDEPTGNLDKENTENIMSLVEELNKTHHQTFVVTTHNSDVASYAHETYLLRDGRIDTHSK